MIKGTSLKYALLGSALAAYVEGDEHETKKIGLRRKLIDPVWKSDSWKTDGYSTPSTNFAAISPEPTKSPVWNADGWKPDGWKSDGYPTKKPTNAPVMTGDISADDLCQDFCTQFFTKCEDYNIYTKSNASNDEARAECLKTCMNWPRPVDPDYYSNKEEGGDSGGGGNHFWCRHWHLDQVVDANNAAFHCPHATDFSWGICNDNHIDGLSPYEWLKQEASTQTRQPCDVAGVVVDCTMGGITDENFHDVLQTLPDNMEILFLNGNSITELNGPLAQHLNEPTNLRALYMNDNGLITVSADAFKGLDNLEVWNADVNEVATLDKDFLQYTPKLKHFSMASNPDLFTPSIPAGFFQHTPKLEVMFTQGTGVSTFLPGTFDGLTSLTLTAFVGNQKITEESFPNPPELFKDLTSLLYFDFFGNPIKSIPENFFGPWASNIKRITFWNCPITKIHRKAGLEHLKSIEQAYFHYYEDGPTDFPGAAGGSFKYDRVLRKLTKNNPNVIMTYGTTTAPRGSL